MTAAIFRSMAALGALTLLPVSACGAPENGADAGTRAADDGAMNQSSDGMTATSPVSDTTANADATGEPMPHPTVLLTTSLGDIRLELFPEDAPVTVENFLAYVEDGFYEGVIFHRVIPNFMIQAGGHTADMTEKENSREPIVNESDNGRNNLRGTVAMARQPAPHTARSQFFINLVDNANLDYGARAGGWGYAVFGRVIEGMDVVDAIAAVPTATVGRQQNVPVEPVVIESATRGEPVEPAGELE